MPRSHSRQDWFRRECDRLRSVDVRSLFRRRLALYPWNRSSVYLLLCTPLASTALETSDSSVTKEGGRLTHPDFKSISPGAMLLLCAMSCGTYTAV
ncbi:hypothetical protein BJY00DRAFT_285498 [Aspergillus carlsbadensis]|nr:hypothetical protein BJY00DRAFT_285498 [Aspergillus carlsbadensis]